MNSRNTGAGLPEWMDPLPPRQQALLCAKNDSYSWHSLEPFCREAVGSSGELGDSSRDPVSPGISLVFPTALTSPEKKR